MQLLWNLLSLFFILCLQISLPILKICQLVSLLHYLVLQLFDLLLHLGAEILLFSIIPGLHFRLLNEHLLLDLIYLLLLLNLHLVDYSSIFFSQLLDIVHQLLVCFSRFLVSALKIVWFLKELLVLNFGIFELLRQIFLDRLVVALFESKSQMIWCFELIGLKNFE